MKALPNLKNRLLALDGIREAKNHQALYSEFLKRTGSALENLKKAALVSTNAALVLPGSGYQEAMKTVRSSGKIASRLREKMNADPAAIAEKATEVSFTRLFDYGTGAFKSCQLTWENQLQAKLKDWQTIADVVSRLGEGTEAKPIKAQAKKLKAAIDSLVVAKSKMPVTEKEVSKVQSDLNDLNESVSQLGLNTPFGKFLQDAASPLGADLAAVEIEEVSKQIAELKLSKVFRVRLSS